MALGKLCFRIYLCLFICTIVSPLLADTVSSEKTYVLPSQIHILSEGIFFVNAEGELKSASGVFFDDDGLYVRQAFQQCPSCHLWSRDGSLHRISCPFYTG
ncbi:MULTISPECIES: hypothetical protein [Parachlamydia]|jgi:hypothetical protein|uniref:hypothetical protein n=1 Tax=Parachlamydia TaxID=83551 RepID=UPI0001C1767C|nr:hypothetical protein [Parachlamydia acanthamoebae]EFB42241.1 hypothetical protein pah_c014o191 [Parachlamydia acanthamoebae str. Hall's coccus]